MSKFQIAPFARHRTVASRRRRSAQSLVETTLCLVFILLPMVFAGLQFSIIINANHALEEIAREGARFAAIHGGEGTFDDADTQSNPPSYRYYIKQVCANTSIRYTDLQPITIPTIPSSGQPVTVNFTYPMSKKMIFFPAKWNGAGTFGYGTFMNTLNQPRPVSATYIKE